VKPPTPAPSARLEVHVKPRSSREGIGRGAGGALEVRVAAAPAHGEANEAVLRLLSRALGLRRTQLIIERGQAGRRKLIRVAGVSPEELERLLAAAAIK